MDLRLVGNRAFAVFSSLFNPRPVAPLPVFSTNKWLEVANDQLRHGNDFSPEEKQDSSLSLNQVCHGKKRISNSAVERVTATLRWTRFCCYSRQVEKLLQLTFCSTGSRQTVEETRKRLKHWHRVWFSMDSLMSHFMNSRISIVLYSHG